MFYFYIIFFFIFGSIWGSFANVIIARLPKNESVVFPGSKCPKCNNKIYWYHNIPVISWILLKGRCFHCHEVISFRYPLVEIIMGTLFSLVFWKFGFTWLTLEYLIFFFGLVTISFIDLDHMIIPDIFSLSGILIGLLGAWLNYERSFSDALLGLFLGGGFLWLVAYIYWLLRKREGLGGGDIKLIAWIGTLLGWKAIPFIILFASILGGLVGLVFYSKSGNFSKLAIPFGPFLSVSTIVYVLAAEKIGLWYIKLFLPWII